MIVLPGSDDMKLKRRRSAFANTSTSCLAERLTSVLSISFSSIALYTKLQQLGCLTHIGREGPRNTVDSITPFVGVVVCVIPSFVQGLKSHRWAPSTASPAVVSPRTPICPGIFRPISPKDLPQSPKC